MKLISGLGDTGESSPGPSVKNHCTTAPQTYKSLFAFLCACLHVCGCICLHMNVETHG